MSVGQSGDPSRTSSRRPMTQPESMGPTVCRDVGPELPGDRDRREQSKRELERLCRLSAVKALGYSVPPFSFRTLMRSDDDG